MFSVFVGGFSLLKKTKIIPTPVTAVEECYMKCNAILRIFVKGQLVYYLFLASNVQILFSFPTLAVRARSAVSNRDMSASRLNALCSISRNFLFVFTVPSRTFIVD